MPCSQTTVDGLWRVWDSLVNVTDWPCGTRRLAGEGEAGEGPPACRDPPDEHHGPRVLRLTSGPALDEFDEFDYCGQRHCQDVAG